MSAPRSIFHLALREAWDGAGARFVERDGWSVPADFGNPEAEHRAIRERAALIERSQRSRFMVTGTDAAEVLQAVFAGYPNELEEGRAMRTVRVDSNGRIRDLVQIARTGGIAYMVSGEPSQRVSTQASLEAARAPEFDAEISDRTMSTCLLELTGPAASHIAAEHLQGGFPVQIQPMHLAAFLFHGFRALAVRTSTTGEDGYEVMVAPAVGQHIIETLRGAGVALAGADAAEIARVEACVPAYTPDLEPGLTVSEADLAFLEAGDQEAQPARLLSALLFDQPQTHQPGTPVTQGGHAAGEVRSCVHSTTLNATIGLGIIDSAHASPGTDLEVAGGIATVTAKPFLRRSR